MGAMLPICILRPSGHVVALRGRVSIEWPQNAGTWQLPEVIAFLERHNMQKVVCHGCSFGLRGKQHPLKKPWIIASNDSRVPTSPREPAQEITRVNPSKGR